MPTTDKPKRRMIQAPTADEIDKAIEESIVVAVKHGLAPTFRRELRNTLQQKFKRLLRDAI